MVKPGFPQGTPGMGNPGVGGQFTSGNPGQPSAGMGQRFADASQIIQVLGAAGSPAQPLEKIKFEGALQNFFNTRKILLNSADLHLDGKQIDLHSLHTNVMESGGFQKVRLSYYYLDQCDLKCT
jgi:hypothetical protein